MTYKHPKKPNDNLLANLLYAVGSLQANFQGFKIRYVMKMVGKGRVWPLLQ